MNLKVLTIGYDGSIIDKDSKLAKRSVEYGKMVKKYTVLSPAKKDLKVNLSENTIGVGIKSMKAPFVISRLFSLFHVYRKANKLIKRDDYNIISVQDPFELALISFILAKKFKIGLNIQEHGDFFSQTYWRNENIINFIRFYLGRWLIKKADSVRVVSEKIKKTLIGIGVEKKKIILVPVYTPLKIDEYKFTNNKEFIFLWIGRFVKQKNLPLLIEAFANVIKSRVRCKLKIIGKGPEKKRVELLIKNYNLSDNVEVIDWIDDTDSEYREADAYVLSSDYEGWGRVIVEAVSHGVPIIMTDVGCANEVIENGSSGLIIPTRNKKELTNSMIKFVNNDNLRNELSKNAFMSLKKLLNKEETLSRYKKSWELAMKN